jgi:hypothetical protein
MKSIEHVAIEEAQRRYPEYTLHSITIVAAIITKKGMPHTMENYEFHLLGQDHKGLGFGKQKPAGSITQDPEHLTLRESSKRSFE